MGYRPKYNNWLLVFSNQPLHAVIVFPIAIDADEIMSWKR